MLFNSFKHQVRVTVFLTVFSICVFLPLSAFELTEPTAKDRRITRVVTLMMERAHLLQHELDDEISNRSITSFIDRLDPMRLYFLKSDVEGFMKKKDTIDDMVSEGDITFAYDVFKTYLDRIDERLPVINELIDADHDFSAKESINTDWDNVSFAESKDEAEDRWRKRIKYNLLVLKGDDETEERSKERLHRRYNSFSNQMHRTDSDELLEMFLNSVMASFDPHTSYMSPTTLENFEIVMRLNLDGIGAGLTMQDGDTVITKIIPGGAADKHGELKVNDRIVDLSQDFGLNQFLDRPSGKLSAGQKTRVALAKALLNKPKLLLLDEPTASMDPDTADVIRQHLIKYQRDTNATIILASHNMSEIEQLCQNVLIMKNGEIVAQGAPSTLVANFQRQNLEQVFLDIARYNEPMRQTKKDAG